MGKRRSRTKAGSKTAILSKDEAEEKLRDYLYDGLLLEIFLADQAYALAKVIGENAELINSSNYGSLFGNFQEVLSDRQTLAIAKIFERPNSTYQTRSIPAVLLLLESNASCWSPRDRRPLVAELEKAGENKTILEGLNDFELTHAVVAHYRSTLPEPTNLQSTLSVSLEALRESRNKVIAHNESVDRTKRKRTTWGEALPLVSYAKKFLSVIGRGFLNSYFEINGEFLMSEEAQLNARDLKRLLAEANLLMRDSVTPQTNL